MDLRDWFSALHPYFVHFPLALLLTLLLVELLWRRRLDRELHNLLLFGLVVSGIAGAVAAISGVLLSRLASHPLEQVAEHQWQAYLTLWLLLACIGLKALSDSERRQRLVEFLHLQVPLKLLGQVGRAVSGGRRAPIWRTWWMRLMLSPLLLLRGIFLLVTWPLRVLLGPLLRWLWTRSSWRAAYLASLLLVVVSVNTTGRLGASLAHGAAHPLLPPWGARPEAAALAPAPTGEYYRQVKPLLDDYCIRCHGPGTQKGNLRLDDRESLLARRDPLPAVAPGDIMGSDVIRRMLLPRDHTDAMPPAGEQQPDERLLNVLSGWIERGALFGDPPAPPRTLPEYRLTAGLDELADLETGTWPAAGVRVRQLAEDVPLLEASFRAVEPESLSTAWADIDPLLDRIAWLDLSGHVLSADILFRVGSMPRLTRLNLQGARIAEGDALALSGLVELRRLNLLDTGLERRLIGSLDLPRLEQLYVSNGSVD